MNTTKQLTKDEFAKFIFDISNNIKNFQFDVFYDIAKIVKAITSQSIRDKKTGEIITDRKVTISFWLQIRESGSYIFRSDELDQINSIKRNFSGDEFILDLCLNHSYLNKTKFAEVTKIKQ